MKLCENRFLVQKKKVKSLFFFLLLALSISSINCNSSHVHELKQEHPLEAYVPNYKEMTLVHSTRFKHLEEIFQSGELTRLALGWNVFRNVEDDRKSDWTTLIFTQVVHKKRLNSYYYFTQVKRRLAPENEPVLIELDLNLLTLRKDYTVAHDMNLYYGARFEIDQNFKDFNRPVLGTEVAEGDNPNAVKKMLEKDFAADYTGEKNGYYQNEVVFRKGPIDLKKMNIKLHFMSVAQKDEFLGLGLQAIIEKSWNEKIDPDTISLTSKIPYVHAN